MEVKNGIIIQAKFIRGNDKAWLLDCEGDVSWFPKSQCNFNLDKEELEAPKWLLQQKFPREQY